MKLCVSNIAWEKNERFEIYKLMQTYGISCLEVAPSRITNNPYESYERDLLDYKRELENLEFEIVAMQSMFFGINDISIFGNETSKKKLLDESFKAIDFAASAGARFIVFGNPKMRNYDGSKESIADAIQYFKKLGEYGYRNNVTICLEAAPIDYGANFLNNVIECNRFINDNDILGVGLHLDIGACYLNKTPLESIEKLVRNIKHVHISAPFLQALSTVDVDFYNNILQILVDEKYQGYTSFELKPTGSNLKDLEANLEFFKPIMEKFYV